ncbi:protein kinase [Candidatus Uabimicrobium sp. HlEnr_7]|uniref:protein kinase domain-containing protein n=1 Tax=Candidatus Uabimicrobium helgolandensis TaxID=3095367 RepID=UPI0035587254
MQDYREIDLFIKKAPKFIDKYKIVNTLGRGGMGVVYLAYDSELKRKVALKIIYKHSHINLQRFLLEAKSIGMLDHPNIVKLYNLSTTENGTPYIVMQYVKGKTLEEYLVKNALSFKQKISLIIPILEAMHYAHEKGIIHRDIKPSNILISKERKPLLMDFGLVKIMESKSLTQTGVVVGTLGYMSPEQAWQTSKKVDHRTDIYSFGVLIYKILSNHMPTSGENILEFVKNLTEKKIIPLRCHNKKIPRYLQSICNKALAKNRDSRYRTALDFANHLKIFIEQNSLRSFWHINYKYIVVILFFLCATCMYKIFPTSKRPKQSQQPILIIQKWIQNEFYDKANQELEQVKTKLSLHTYHIHKCILASKKYNASSFQKHYAILTKKQKELDIVQLAKAEIYIHQKKWPEALHTLKKIDPQTPNTKFYVPYYTAQIYYQKKNFKLAKNYFNFAKLAKIKTEQLYIDIAKSCLHLKEFVQMQQVLANIKNQATDFPEIFLLLGRAAMGLDQYQQAESFFRQLLAIQKQSNTYFWLSKSLISQRKYQDASLYLQKARQLDPTNLEIFKEYTSIAIYNMDLIKDRYLEFFTDLEKWRYIPENFTDLEIAKLRNLYRKHYVQMKTLSQKNFSQKQCQLFIGKLSDPKISKQAQKALFIMRYSKHISLLRKTNPGLYTEIINLKHQEQQNALYYQLAEISLDRNSEHISRISLEQTKSIASNGKEPVLHRYIATKTLLYMLKINLVNELRLRAIKNRDIYSEVIYDGALRSISIHTNINNKKFPYFPHKKLIFIPHFLQTYQLPYSHIQALIDQKESPEISILVALHYYQKSDEHQQLCFPIIKKYVYDKNPNLSSFTIKYFWRSMNSKRKDPLYKEMWTDLAIHLPLLNDKAQQAVLSTACLKNYSIPIKIIQQLLSSNPTTSTTMLIINYLSQRRRQDIIENYYKNEKNNSTMRVYGYHKSLTTDLQTKYKGIIPTDFITSKDKFLRSYAYIMYAYLGEETLRFLEKESTDMQAFILKVSVFPVLPIVGKQNAKFPHKKRLAIIRKYQKHKNKNVRRYAYFAEVFQDYGEKKIDLLIKKFYQKSDIVVKKGVASAIRDRLTANIEIYDRHFIEQLMFFTQKYHPQAALQINKYLKLSLVKKINIYKQMLLQIKKLDHWYANDFYQYGVILNQENKQKLAIESFKKAINLNNSILYNIELVKLLWQYDKNALPHYLNNISKLNLEKRIYPTYHHPLLQMGKNIAIEKILMQNYIAQTQYGSHIKARRQALQNLKVYYEKTQDKIKYSFYQTALSNQITLHRNKN